MKPDIWINCEFIPWEKASIHPFSHSMQRGATLFESIDCNEAVNGRPAIFRLPDHMKRFECSASIIGMPLPYNLEALINAIVDTVSRSEMKNCLIRPLAFYSETVMQVFPEDSKVTVIIGLYEPHFALKMHRVTISRLRKIDGVSMPVKAKVSGNYIAPMIAKSEAVRAGFDDTIILDRDGFVAEGATSNIFIVEQGKLVTAPEDTILAGITRDTVITIAAKLGIDVILDKFTPERLKTADEAILCSSGNEVTPITQVDDTMIGDGKPGLIATRLHTYYSDVISGRIPEFEYWLTYV